MRHADPVAQAAIDRLTACLRDIAAALPKMAHHTGCPANYRHPFSWNHCQCWQNSIRSRIPHHLRGDL